MAEYVITATNTTEAMLDSLSVTIETNRKKEEDNKYTDIYRMICRVITTRDLFNVTGISGVDANLSIHSNIICSLNGTDNIEITVPTEGTDNYTNFYLLSQDLSPIDQLGGQLMTLRSEYSAVTRWKNIDWFRTVGTSGNLITFSSTDECSSEMLDSLAFSSELEEVEIKSMEDSDAGNVTKKERERSFCRASLSNKYYNVSGITISSVITLTDALTFTCNGTDEINLPPGTDFAFWNLTSQELFPINERGSKILMNKREFVTASEWAFINLLGT